MVDAVVSFAIQKLGEFIAQEVQIRIGVRDGVRWLKDELDLLQPSINKAESRQEDEIIRKWVNSVRDVIGFEDDIKTLMGELNSEDLSLKVISIHGMGGLGKTSLATKLYNSSELRQFDTRAKVCVSNEYSIKDVLKRIVKSFMGPEHEQYLSTMDEHDLVQYLSKLLQDRGRYIALIDDIWEIKAWDQIKIAFADQKNGSRIIITTRKKEVAEMVDDKCFVHPLRFLKEEESWQLFCKRAEPATPNMEKLGKEMVDKCRGLPLAIVVLSGLLSHNRSYDYWSKVKDHMWRHLKEDDSNYFRIKEILSLSYNDLSPQMKDCFLYLARYPEDHVIRADELKLLWIAEEFISEAEEGEGLVMEDLAEDYLNELINRNLIQVELMQLHFLGLYSPVNTEFFLLATLPYDCLQCMRNCNS